jgi:hypothetical protein
MKISRVITLAVLSAFAGALAVGAPQAKTRWVKSGGGKSAAE